MPCATENELNIDDARQLIKNNCFMVAEVSNMGTTAKAAEYLSENIVFAPGKAVNAGGVSVSGLEMSQNNMRINWTSEEVDKRLKVIMENIHDTCVNYGVTSNQKNKVNYIKGANIGGFVKVADAMLDQGVV
jgi:glutamate dehydrogenase (NADP+)